MRVILRGPGDQYWQIDTPQSELVGIWLKAIFDTFQLKDSPVRIPLTFRIEVS